MSVEEQMPVHTLSNRSNSNDENENSFNPMYKATDDWIPGKEGFLDRFEHLETMASYWRRILASRSFWLKMILYAVLQYLANWIEFGSIFFMLAAMYAIYSSMDSPSPQDRKNIRSAYSVINIRNRAKNARIHGDQSFEQLDKQLRGGGFS